MKTKALILLTGVVVLAGSLTACGHHRPSAEESAEHAAWMVERVSKKLDLNDTQKAKLEVLKTRLLAAREEAAQQHDADRKELLALLAQPTLDRTRVEALVTAHTRGIEAKAPEIIAAAGDFYDSLNAGQQRELREHVESRMNHHWH